MPQHLIDLARRFDERVSLANEANYDESKHPRAEDGKWTSGGGSGGGGTSVKKQADAMKGSADKSIRILVEGGSREDTLDLINGELGAGRWYVKNGSRAVDRADGMSRRKAAHKLAIMSGFKFNRGTGKYE